MNWMHVNVLLKYQVFLKRQIKVITAETVHEISSRPEIVNPFRLRCSNQAVL